MARTYGSSVTGEGHAPGGTGPALKRNPNTTDEDDLNGAPDGPYSHQLGNTGDGGMHGDQGASGKNGEKFHFK